jgi:protocatechuate 3,4-dioxygenase beta subunit
MGPHYVLGRTRTRSLRAPTTTGAVEHTTIDPKTRKCPTRASANRRWPITRTSHWTVSLVKRRTIGRLRNRMYRQELVRKWTILRVILAEVDA